MPKAAATELPDAETVFYDVATENPDNPLGLIRVNEQGEMLPAETAIPEDLDLDSIPSIEDRLAEAKMPVLKKTEDILGHDVVWYACRPQDALLVNEGTITEGFFVLGKDLADGKVFTIFIGGIALCRTLRNVKMPFVARIEKSGRTLVFR